MARMAILVMLYHSAEKRIANLARKSEILLISHINNVVGVIMNVMAHNRSAVKERGTDSAV